MGIHCSSASQLSGANNVTTNGPPRTPQHRHGKGHIIYSGTTNGLIIGPPMTPQHRHGKGHMIRYSCTTGRIIDPSMTPQHRCDWEWMYFVFVFLVPYFLQFVEV